MIRFFIIPAVVLLVFCIDSCSRSPVDSGLSRVDTLYIHDSSTAVLKGRLHGAAQLYGFSGLITNQNAGIKVSLEGTPYSGMTDSLGNWTIENLPTGAYNIVYTKMGYDTGRVFGYPFVGGGDMYVSNPVSFSGASVVYLYKTPEGISIVDLRISRIWQYQGGVAYYVGGRMSPWTPGLSAFVVVGHDTTVSFDPATYTMSVYMPGFDSSGNFIDNVSIPNTTFYAYGFKKGEKAFMVAYVYVGNARFVYFDPRCNCSLPLGGRSRSNVCEMIVP